MIKLKLNSFKSDADTEFGINDGELLSTAIWRVLEGIPLNDQEPERLFQALVNGMLIDPDLWTFTKIKSTDTVLVAVALGDSGTLKQGLLLGAIIAASLVLGPGAFGITGYAFAGTELAIYTAAASFAASLALNALIPTPLPSFSSSLGSDSQVAQSQMYTITSQGNSTKKFGFVPKVYGRHRMFPVIAANPYTEVEVSPVTNELTQYLYAIYDFGLGPVAIEDVKIGDSDIGLYLKELNDGEWRLVDLNKPAVSEGYWDNALNSDFKYYKSDVQITPLSLSINGNSGDGDPLSEYQIITTSASNPMGFGQQITLNFVCPGGLYGFSSAGVIGTRTIEMEIHFALVGTEDWKPYNSLTFVNDFSAVGGDQRFTPFNTLLFDPLYDGLPEDNSVYQEILPRPPLVFLKSKRNFGYRTGTTQLWIANTVAGTVAVGDLIYYRSTFLGVVTVNANTGIGYRRITLDRPLAADITLFYFYYDSSGNYIPYASLGETDEGEGSRPGQRDNKILDYRPTIGFASIARDETNPVYATFKFTPKIAGQYKVRARRTTTFSTYTAQIKDALTLTSIGTRLARPPIVTDKRHVFLELKIRSTNQLNGAIGNLSAIATSILDTWDGATWIKKASSNPAWIFTDLLIGEANKRPVPKSRLHLPSLLEWANYCDVIPTPPPGKTYLSPRFQTNLILDYDTTLQTLLQQVASTAQAGFNLIDGKYGVLIDVLRTVPVQIFTSRNSKDFSSSRVYTKKPDALTVKFIAPELDWGVTEFVVYDDGFDETTALEFEDIVAFGCTNHEQAWRFARYMMGQNRLRQETINLSVDFEYLVCTRGDFVQIAQDVMKVGGTPARVKSRVGNRIVIDDSLESLPISYGFVYRASNGNIVSNNCSFVFSDTFDLSGALFPNVGDLIIIGETGKVVINCIVKTITPNDDLTANLTLVEQAPAIYAAESTLTFPPYDPQLSQTVNADFAVPNEVEALAVTDNFYYCASGDYQYYIDIDWEAPLGSTYETFLIYVNDGKGYKEVARTRTSLYTYLVNSDRIDKLHSFKVLAISASGKVKDLGAVGEVTATPITKMTLPSDVTFFSSDITGEVLQLSWIKINDCDCREYLIRYSPVVTGTWVSSIPLLKVDRNTNTATTQARTGVYLIKAVDFNGNESALSAQIITTIPNLFGLNIITEVTDFPALLGTFDKTVKAGATLLLDKAVPGDIFTAQFYTEGFYYYRDLLDLGEIFTVRLQSLIQAEGYTEQDLMVNWTTLDTVQFLASAGTSDWDVEAQYRSTEALNVMSEWLILSNINPINEGEQGNFTPWRKFVVGDATGRIFQFRLKLISNKLSVSPRVFDGTIRADMPDRIESYTNILASSGGYTLNYTPAFRGPGTSPNIQISIDGASTGDYWVLSAKTLSGFTIRFYNSSNVAVARTFDASIKGYGSQATVII